MSSTERECEIDRVCEYGYSGMGVHGIRTQVCDCGSLLANQMGRTHECPRVH